MYHSVCLRILQFIYLSAYILFNPSVDQLYINRPLYYFMGNRQFY